VPHRSPIILVASLLAVGLVGTACTSHTRASSPTRTTSGSSPVAASS